MTAFNRAAGGFEPQDVDRTPRIAQADAITPVTQEEGKRLAEFMGCVACHSADGIIIGKVGPSRKGLFGSTMSLGDGRSVRADEACVRLVPSFEDAPSKNAEICFFPNHPDADGV